MLVNSAFAAPCSLCSADFKVRTFIASLSNEVEGKACFDKLAVTMTASNDDLARTDASR